MESGRRNQPDRRQIRHRRVAGKRHEGRYAQLLSGVIAGAIVLFGVLGTALVTLTFLPALTVMVLQWGKAASGRPAPVQLSRR